MSNTIKMEIHCFDHCATLFFVLLCDYVKYNWGLQRSCDNKYCQMCQCVAALNILQMDMTPFSQVESCAKLDVIPTLAHIHTAPLYVSVPRPSFAPKTD